MQSMPFLLRHSLRSSLHFPRTTRPIRPQFTPAVTSSPLHYPTRDSSRTFSVCLRCQFASRSALYSSNESDKGRDGHGISETREKAELQPEEQRIESTTGGTGNGNQQERKYEQQKQEGKEDLYHEPNPDTAEGQRLPSSMESRRSQWSKQFSTMMDNVQSNVFVAGQRLNDLTGYSSIEALKKSIQSQEDRLREARSHVRKTKEDYTTAINRRSTSQREVNELLQRKHAWSSTDLERFTHLYRNDHANEVAEHETQESFSAAEREAEEAAANLSKSILSRYHEEQIWSDKIRRMSTWGTWGLMGVNVLLFLIFQIAVEPWRRRRLVKGFEEKVLEALDEKDRAVVTGKVVEDEPSAREAETSTSTSTSTSPVIPETSESVPVTNEAPTTDTPALQPESEIPDSSSDTSTSVLASGKSQLSRLSSLPPTSVESWRNTFHDLFSDRSLAITQRDLTTVAIQSAAAGAAVMGFVIALIRPR